MTSGYLFHLSYTARPPPGLNIPSESIEHPTNGHRRPYVGECATFFSYLRMSELNSFEPKDLDLETLALA